MYSFDSIYKVNPRQRQVKRYYFYNRRCKVVGLYGLTRESFVKATIHLHKVLTHPSFSTWLRKKRRWSHTHQTSAMILRRLQKQQRVIVNSFRRDKGFPCKTDKASGHVNGFAKRGVKILFLYKPFVLEQGQLGAWGVRNLARTLLHETLHTLGYSHAGLKVGSADYNNSVPVFLGCVAKHWPEKVSSRRLRKLQRFCSLSSRRKINLGGMLPWWQKLLKKWR